MLPESFSNCEPVLEWKAFTIPLHFRHKVKQGRILKICLQFLAANRCKEPLTVLVPQILWITTTGLRVQIFTKLLQEWKLTHTHTSTWQKWVLRCFIFSLELWIYSLLHCEFDIITKKPVCGRREDVISCFPLVVSCSQGAFQEEGMTDR